MTVKILSKLVVTPVRGKISWKLYKDWNLNVDNESLVIKQGFKTDFASVPRFAWFFVPPADGFYRQPAVLHDWMYVKAYKTKKYADKTFLKFMEKMGVPLFKRYVMYFAVRLFGRGNY